MNELTDDKFMGLARDIRQKAIHQLGFLAEAEVWHRVFLEVYSSIPDPDQLFSHLDLK